MQRKRVSLLLGVIMLSGLAISVRRLAANPETVRIVVPGVWFREGDTDRGHCNNAIIEMKDYLIVVDANYPGGARGLMADLVHISRKPVKYVFDTHHHGDHTYANSLWTQAGATTLAFKDVAEEMKRFEPARWLDSVKGRPDVAELHRDAPEPPTQLINEDLYVLNDGSRKVEFRHPGYGHTRGDGYVYLPKEQVLCTGDAVVNGPYNNFKDANLANWPLMLRAVGKLKIKFVLPGHGMFGGKELLSGQEQFLTELRQAVQKGVEQGQKEPQIQASLKFSAAAEPWAAEKLLQHQVADAYLEVTQNKPRGDLPH